MAYSDIAVDDRGTAPAGWICAEVTVEDGDDIILLNLEDPEGYTEGRFNISEALALIASLTAAVQEAIKAR